MDCTSSCTSAERSSDWPRWTVKTASALRTLPVPTSWHALVCIIHQPVHRLIPAQHSQVVEVLSEGHLNRNALLVHTHRLQLLNDLPPAEPADGRYSLSWIEFARHQTNNCWQYMHAWRPHATKRQSMSPCRLLDCTTDVAFTNAKLRTNTKLCCNRLALHSRLHQA